MTETTNEAAAILTSSQLHDRVRAALGSDQSLYTLLPRPIAEIIISACATAGIDAASGVSMYLYNRIIEATEVA